MGLRLGPADTAKQTPDGTVSQTAEAFGQKLGLVVAAAVGAPPVQRYGGDGVEFIGQASAFNGKVERFTQQLGQMYLTGEFEASDHIGQRASVQTDAGQVLVGQLEITAAITAGARRGIWADGRTAAVAVIAANGLTQAGPAEMAQFVVIGLQGQLAALAVAGQDRLRQRLAQKTQLLAASLDDPSHQRPPSRLEGFPSRFGRLENRVCAHVGGAGRL